MKDLLCEEPPVATEWLVMTDHGGANLPLGERLKQLRQERGLSQADLAAKVGTDPGQISRYENGRMAPSAEAVARLADVLDVSCDYLLIEDSPRRPLHTPEDVLGDRLGAIAELDDDDRHSLLNVIDALVAKSRLRVLTGGLSRSGSTTA
jgi:transcriptional regulator with XRE-family HTH domain